MVTLILNLKRIVTAITISVMISIPCAADTNVLDDLFSQLQQDDAQDWKRIEKQIWAEWSKSGSTAMDLLLRRGRDAMAAGDLNAAIDHLSALIDHAPEFAEGWNARATAYFQAGLLGPSVEDIRQTLALNPRHFGALSGLGIILEQINQPKEALRAFRRAKALHPHRPDLSEAINRLELRVLGQHL